MVIQKFDFGLVAYFSQTAAWFFLNPGSRVLCSRADHSSVQPFSNFSALYPGNNGQYLQNQHELNQNKDKHIFLNYIYV